MTVLVTACTDAAPVWIGYPDVPTAGALILALDDGSTVRRFAIDLAGPGFLHSDAEQLDSVRLEAVALSETLVELGLSVGELLPSPSESCALPLDVVGHYEAGPSDEDAFSWFRTEEYGALLGGYELPDTTGACRCPRFTLELDIIPNPELARFAVPLGTDRVLAVMAEGTLRWFDLGSGARSSTITRPSSLTGATLTAGAVDESELIWLASSDGRIWRVDDTDTLSATAVAQVPRGSSVDVLIVLDADPPEIVTFGAHGKVDILRGDTWSELYAFESPGSDPLLVVDPLSRESLAVLSNPVRAVRLGADGPVPLPNPDFATSVRSAVHAPKLGFVIGGNEGELARMKGDRWERLADEGTLRGVFAFLPYEGQVIYGGDFGFLASLNARAGRCLIDARGAEPIGTLNRLGRDLISVPTQRDFETIDTRVSRFRNELP